MSSSGSPPFESHIGALSDAVRERLRQFTASNFTARLWKRDPTLWNGDDARQKVVANRLGWLGSVGAMQSSAGSLQDFARGALAEGLDTAVLLGMGGSSLCPEVFATIFGGRDQRMSLIVLDTTDPGAILSAEESIQLDRSLFIVSSKSGGTIETLSLHAHFMERLRSAGVPDPGRRFVAITDPGSPLQDLATAEGFRRCFLNPADIGGRYSALSFFGLVPAALIGMDIPRLLDRASKMAASCGPGSLPEQNPGVRLGAILGEAALQGQDKLTFLLSPEIAPFGFWVEQLIAESTGKEGHGILPVEGEPSGPPPVWGKDRLVVYLRLSGSGRSPTDAAAAAFREAAHPLVRLDLEDRYDLGGEFLRWEIATATAGAVLGLNPFDEPNVKESKDNTARILRSVEESGALPELQPVETDGPLEIHADPSLASSLQAERERRDWPRNAAGLIAALIADAPPGDYVAMMAWLERRRESEELLQSIRGSLRDALALATTLGYGPRFLHSTGQYHKGGPERGIFLQITANAPHDLPIPGRPWSFSTLEAAQAQGDLEALNSRGRKALRVHLRDDVVAGLKELKRRVEEAVVLVPRSGH